VSDEKKDIFTRRGFLGTGSAALAAAGMLSAKVAAAQAQQPYPAKEEGPKPYPTKDSRSASAPGPGNQVLDEQNPDSFLPPQTDAGGVQTFKYPFGISHKRMQQGGWSREVTIREMAISKTIAGVDMRLTAGGIRELHWHTAAEWAFMLYGNARITGLDAEGKSFVTDITEGDLWYFPTGIPHSIQGLNPDGCEFLLVFDDGNFSEYETVLLTDWMAHTPHDVLAFRGQSRRIRNRLRVRLGCRRWILRFGLRNRRLRSVLKGVRCGLWIRPTLKCRPRLRRRLLRCIREGSANCIGILMPTNGSTTSAAPEE